MKKLSLVVFTAVTAAFGAADQTILKCEFHKQLVSVADNKTIEMEEVKKTIEAVQGAVLEHTFGDYRLEVFICGGNPAEPPSEVDLHIHEDAKNRTVGESITHIGAPYFSHYQVIPIGQDKELALGISCDKN
jgi:hypothetical protein